MDTAKSVAIKERERNTLDEKRQTENHTYAVRCSVPMCDVQTVETETISQIKQL